VHWIVALVIRQATFLSRLVKGRSDLLVVDGKVQIGALKAAYMSPDDLAEDMRKQGVADLDSVKSARLERSGKLSVIKSNCNNKKSPA
jgi:uncharacterized membrane protein YcaP (DUF421 family)